MKFHVRGLAAVVLAAVLSLSMAPLSVAAPRDPGDDPPAIVKIIKKFRKLFGLVANDEQPIPPRP
jgi:hypothetical protein